MSDTGKIPQIHEFTTTTPPGWSPRLIWYTFRMFMMKLKLWWKITTATEAQSGPLIAARLEGRPFDIAMQLSITRTDPQTMQSQTFVGENALELPQQDEVRDPITNAIAIPKSASGAAQLVQALMKAYQMHDDDRETELLDEFFDHRRGNQTLLDYLVGFDMKFEEARNRANLGMTNNCKTHLLFKWSGLHPRRVSDIKLHVEGDTKRYDQIYSLLMRTAKGEVTGGPVAHYADDWYGASDYYDV